MGYLIFSAALALALFGAGVAAQWTARRNNDEVLQRVEVLAREGRVEDALGVAHALQGASAAVLIAGFTRATEAEAEIAMERARGAQRDARYALGAIPVQRLKAREKAAGVPNPSAYAAS